MGRGSGDSFIERHSGAEGPIPDCTCEKCRDLEAAYDEVNAPDLREGIRSKFFRIVGAREEMLHGEIERLREALTIIRTKRSCFGCQFCTVTVDGEGNPCHEKDCIIAMAEAALKGKP